jgi:hypothetical protein
VEPRATNDGTYVRKAGLFGEISESVGRKKTVLESE